MPAPIRIPLTEAKVIEMRHARCTFTADDVRRDAKDNWPKTGVDMLWVLENGAAQVKDRVWLALQGLRELGTVPAYNALCRAIRRLLKRLLTRSNIEPVQTVGSNLLSLLDLVIAAETLTNGPQESSWSAIEANAWELARAPSSRAEVRIAATAIARMSELGRRFKFAVLSEVIRLPAELAGASVQLELATEAKAAEYNLQMQDVAAAYRGEI